MQQLQSNDNDVLNFELLIPHLDKIASGPQHEVGLLSLFSKTFSLDNS